MFTNKETPEIVQYFKDFQRESYARTGSTASQTVTIPGGAIRSNDENILVTVPLDDEDPSLHPIPSSMEPLLRSFGLATSIKDGIVSIPAPHTVCREGEVLSDKQCQILV